MAPQKQKRKITALRDWPLSERPRERLFRDGVQVLSDAELLALFLRSGIPGENVRDLALKLLKWSDGLEGLARRAPRELLEFPGLGPAKVATLIASFEIGNRLLVERLDRRPLIASASDLFDLLSRSLSHERDEVFLGVALNAKNEVLRVIPFSRGDATRVVISVSQVIRRLLREGVAVVVFVHNHPSGDPAPSHEDRALTRRLSQACAAVDITMHDHVILGKSRSQRKPNFFSFSQEGLLKIRGSR